MKNSKLVNSYIHFKLYRFVCLNRNLYAFARDMRHFINLTSKANLMEVSKHMNDVSQNSERFLA